MWVFFFRGPLFKTLDFSVGVARVSARDRGHVKLWDLLFSPWGRGGEPPPNTLSRVSQEIHPRLLSARSLTDLHREQHRLPRPSRVLHNDRL